MKQTTKKLELNKKTIAALSVENLNKVKGGTHVPSVKTRDCLFLSLMSC